MSTVYACMHSAHTSSAPNHGTKTYQLLTRTRARQLFNAQRPLSDSLLPHAQGSNSTQDMSRTLSSSSSGDAPMLGGAPDGDDPPWRRHSASSADTPRGASPQHAAPLMLRPVVQMVQITRPNHNPHSHPNPDPESNPH